MLTRFCKVLLVFNVFCLFALFVYNNVVDLHTNWEYTQHILSMDSVFPNNPFKWRALTQYNFQAGAYLIIIVWQALVVLFLFLGLIRLLANLGDPMRFHAVKGLATFGLTLGFLLFGLGFVAIANEWFFMWQSKNWNPADSLGLFCILIGFVLLFLQQREPV